MPTIRARRRRPLRAGALLLAGLIAAGASPALGQEYGRWWWDGRVGYSERSDRQALDGLRLRDYAEDELQLSLGINGYLAHPAIGQFRLGVDFRGLALEQSGFDSSDRLGYSLDLNVLPRGAVSGRFHVAEETIDYQIPEGAGTFLLLRLPESGSSRRASVRIRRGPLLGTQVGYGRSEYRYGSGSERVDLFEDAFLDWARPLGGLQNHFRLGRQQRGYASVAYDSESWLAGFDQSGPVGESWTWLLSASAQRLDLRLFETSLPTQDDFRYRQRLERTIRQRDRLDLQLEGAAVRREDLSTLAYGAGVFYRYRPRPGWDIVPFVRVQVIEDGAQSLRAPRVGLELTRFWERPVWRGLLGARAGYGRVQRTRESVVPDGSDFSLSLSGSLSRGEAERLRTELEGEIGRGEFRFSERGAGGLPDATFGSVPLGEEDFARARLRLTRRRGTVRLSGWTEWSGRRVVPIDRADPIDRQALTTTLEAGRGTLSFVGNAGRVRVDAAQLRERGSFAVGTLAWRPFRPLELRASYRRDLRRFDALPELGAKRIDAGASFQAGLLTLSATAYRTWEEVTGGGERQNDGVTFLIQRDFAGWLPVVTGERRRGTVR